MPAFKGIFLRFYWNYPKNLILIDSLPYCWKLWLIKGVKLINFFYLSLLLLLFCVLTASKLVVSFYCSSDDSYHLALISVIDTVPLRNLVDHIVSKILLSCMKLSEKDGYAASSESGMSCNLFALFIIIFFQFQILLYSCTWYYLFCNFHYF